MDAEIREWIEAGSWREAAEACEERGLLRDAEALYERLLDHAAAGRVAEMDGRPIRALAHFIRGRSNQDVERVRLHLMATLSERVSDAIDLLREHRLYFQAAELAESVGQLEDAAELYRASHEALSAAVLFERIGRFREAGELYETFLVSRPESVEAQLGMGRILQRFERHRDACSALTRAMNLAEEKGSAAWIAEARHRLAFSLIQIRFEEAARVVLAKPLPEDWDGEVPSAGSIPAFLSYFDNQYGAVGGGFSERYAVRGSVAGPFAEAYDARDTMAERGVLIQPLYGSTESRRAYVGALRQLSNPVPAGILALVDVDESLRYVVFEAPGGEPLSEILNGDVHWTGEQVRSLIRQLISAVEAAHKRGVLHGALNPWSVYVRPGMGVVLAGFELSVLGSREETQTAGGDDHPLSYMAPELAFGGVGDLRSDFFGVGALVYRLVVGAPPQVGAGVGAVAHEGWRKALASLMSPEPSERPDGHRALRALLDAQDWSSVGVEGRGVGGEVEAAVGERFATVEVRGPGLEDVEDRWLRRRVMRYRFGREVTARERERVRSFALPGLVVLQQILSADLDAGWVLLETLDARPLTEHLEELVLRDKLGVLSRVWETLAELHERGVPLGGFAVDDVVWDEQMHDDLPRLRIAAKLDAAADRAAAFKADYTALERLADVVFETEGGLAGALRRLSGAEGGLGRDALERRLKELEQAGESVPEQAACVREVREMMGLSARRHRLFEEVKARASGSPLAGLLAKRWEGAA